MAKRFKIFPLLSIQDLKEAVKTFSKEGRSDLVEVALACKLDRFEEIHNVGSDPAPEEESESRFEVNRVKAARLVRDANQMREWPEKVVFILVEDVDESAKCAGWDRVFEYATSTSDAGLIHRVRELGSF
ncbi:hypothetical protein HDU98_002142 [Podochytrium sp. JEL0797]|nr:hypothetical protein HDU98_002142 [Podochytrium sp. JEL0797]